MLRPRNSVVHHIHRQQSRRSSRNVCAAVPSGRDTENFRLDDAGEKTTSEAAEKIERKKESRRRLSFFLSFLFTSDPALLSSARSRRSRRS